MRIPSLKVTCIGETSAWGKQFLAELQQADVVEVRHEPNVMRFANALHSAEQQIFFMENFPESRNWITMLAQSAKSFYLVWFARSFSKEDLAFALEKRVYCVFENMKHDDKRIVDNLQKLLMNYEAKAQYDHLIRSMKAILVQAETDEEAKPLVHEMKVAIGKLERCTIQNEFNHQHIYDNEGSEERLPFYQTQDFGDAMLTVEDLERTGVLWIRGKLPFQEGRVEFLQGKLIAASAGDTTGLKAIYRMFLWDDPRFLFSRKDPKEVVSEKPIDTSLKHICREGQSQRGRYDSVRRELPPSEIFLTLEPSSLHPDTGLLPTDFTTLATVLEFGRVSEILDYSSLPDVQVYESLIRLKKNQLIKVDPRSGSR
jgi:hypothetical protein